MRYGPYEAVKELGRGAMGVVYAGRAPDGTAVAIKVMLKPGARQASERFDRERRLLVSLGAEQGFVPLLDAGTTPQGPFIVMPYLQGGTLRARLEKGRLSIEEAVETVRSLAESLGHAHARGI